MVRVIRYFMPALKGHFRRRRSLDRLILELQARCGLRIGELLKIKADVSDRTITLGEPKLGEETGRAYMPEAVYSDLSASRLRVET